MRVTRIYPPAQTPSIFRLQFSGVQRAVITKSEKSCFTEDTGANANSAGNAQKA